MRKSRAPDLTEERVQAVLDTLDEWTGKLTWDLLIAAVAEKSGITYSRFTFAEYPAIANAFTLRKESVRGTLTGKPSTPRDERLQAALSQVHRYREKAERLQRQNDALLEQFVVWATNAERKGVTMSMLNAPLPKPDRQRSKALK